MLASNRRRFDTDEGVQSPAFLKGIIHDDAGNPMSPSHAKRGRQRYRYYVSQAILQNRSEEAGSIPRLPAHELEKLVVDATLTRMKEHPATREIGMKLARLTDREIQQQLRALIRRVVVMKESIRVTIDPTRAEPSYGMSQSDSSATTSEDLLTIELPFRFVARGGKTRIMEGTHQAEPSAAPSPALIKNIARGHLWRQQLLNGEVRSVRLIARKAGVTGRYVSRILRLGFLAPELVESIIEGRQPPGLTVENLREPPSYDWAEQRRMLGFASA
jgi:hypothetical protein